MTDVPLSPEQVRETAIVLLAADGVMWDDEDAETAVTRAVKIAQRVDTDPLWMGGSHYGDCTSEAMTCSRCLIEGYEEIVRKLHARGAGVQDIADVLAREERSEVALRAAERELEKADAAVDPEMVNLHVHAARLNIRGALVKT